MKIKCDYCDNYINDTDLNCSICGGENHHLREKKEGVPRTIEELKIWYQETGFPSEDITRFYIGKDIKNQFAYGIYYDEDTKNFIVYMNNNDGSRIVRYEGKDEAYAVNELYIKLREEASM